MFQKATLKNGLTLITIPVPQLNSVTTMVAVGAGSRYETKNIGGISHFLEHMFFKGSRKYPTAEIISTVVDGIGAINNAFTGKEYTGYWIKSSAKHLKLSTEIISSMLTESLLAEEEIEKEKGVIIEEMRRRKDNPEGYIWDLYEELQFGDNPLGWDIVGEEKIINSLKRKDFVDYVDSLYSPKNMVLVYAGKIPNNIKEIAEEYFSSVPRRSEKKFVPFVGKKQTKPRINISYKKSDQAHLVLGVEGYDRYDDKKYAARILSVILGEGMSSRLFMQVRERRGLAYHVSAMHDSYKDAGAFAVYAGLKLEKVMEGLEVIVAELERIKNEKVTEDELKKAKEIVRGRLAIKAESTNFLAEYFGLNFALDRDIETFEEYLAHTDKITIEDVQTIAQELFKKEKFNLQVIGPFKSEVPFQKILK